MSEKSSINGNHDKSTESNNINSCPYLGLRDDPATFSGFPSTWNICYRAQPTDMPALSHQRDYCLKPEHNKCPVFVAEDKQKLPKAIKHHSKGLSHKTKKMMFIGAIGLLSILVILAVFFRDYWTGVLFEGSPILSGRIDESSQSQESTPTMFTTSTMEEMTESPPTPTIIQPSKTPMDIEPSPTKYDPVLALDTPIGDEYEFIIHRVSEGESLQIFAAEYNTNIEAIKAINYDLIAPLWINWIIIIPMNITDVSDLPKFEAYQVTEEKVDIRFLAEKLSANLEDILFYNNLDSDHVLNEGEWLLIPHSESES